MGRLEWADRRPCFSIQSKEYTGGPRVSKHEANIAGITQPSFPYLLMIPTEYRNEEQEWRKLNEDNQYGLYKPIELLYYKVTPISFLMTSRGS